MMLFFYLRGLTKETDLWKRMAESEWFKWRRVNEKTGKQEDVLLQAGLRTSVLGTYEYTFPKESLPTVLAIIGLTEADDIVTGRDKIKLRFKLAVLRKMIGCKKIPKKAFKEAKEISQTIILENSERGLSHLHHAKCSVHLIGIKEDPMGVGEHQLTGEKWIQEMI